MIHIHATSQLFGAFAFFAGYTADRYRNNRRHRRYVGAHRRGAGMHRAIIR